MKKGIKRIWVNEDFAKTIKKIAVDRNKKQIELGISDINSSIQSIPTCRPKTKKTWKFQL